MNYKQSQGRDNNNGYPHTGAWRLRIAHDFGRKAPGQATGKTLDDSILLLKPITIPLPSLRTEAFAMPIGKGPDFSLVTPG